MTEPGHRVGPEALAALADIVGDGNVSCGLAERELLVRPRSEEETAEVIRLARKLRLTLRTADAAPGPAADLLLDLSHLSRILALNRTNHTVEVQAGIGGEALERALNVEGFTLGHFPERSYASSLGQWLGERSAQAPTAKYGGSGDLCLALRGVLANGDAFRGNNTPRSAVGPDLDQLIVGSRSALAVITGAVLAVHPLPRWSRYRAFLFPDFIAGLEALRLVVRSGLDPGRAQLYDEAATRQWREPLRLNAPGALLVIGFEGLDNALNRVKAKQAFHLLARTGTELPPSTVDDWLRLRLAPPPAAGMAERRIEVSALWACVPGLVQALQRALAPLAAVSARTSYLCSTGVAIEYVLSGETATVDEIFLRIVPVAAAAAAGAGGVLRRADGADTPLTARGPAADLFRELKRRIDPENILNPAPAQTDPPAMEPA